MLSAVVERLLKALRAARPGNVRQFFAVASQPARWELNDVARRLDSQPGRALLDEGLVCFPDSGSGLTPVGRRMDAGGNRRGCRFGGPETPLANGALNLTIRLPEVFRGRLVMTALSLASIDIAVRRRQSRRLAFKVCKTADCYRTQPCKFQRRTHAGRHPCRKRCQVPFSAGFRLGQGRRSLFDISNVHGSLERTFTVAYGRDRRFWVPMSSGVANA
jgi:hypothetical protein